MHRDITVHGLLASYLAFGGANINSYAPWRATWPSMADFRDCMPLLWPEGVRAHLQSKEEAHGALYSLLPPAIGSGQWVKESSAGFGARLSKGLLRQQEDRFLEDWAKVKVVCPTADRATFLYSWLIVNTRSVYFELPSSKGARLKADNVALCPFVDLFNHADQGVSASDCSMGSRLSTSATLLLTSLAIRLLQTETTVRFECSASSSGASVDRRQLLARRCLSRMAAITMISY